MQGTRIIGNEETVLSPPQIDIEGMVVSLGRERRTWLATNLELEDALHRYLIKHPNFGGFYIGHGSIANMRLNNPLVYCTHILLGVLFTYFLLEDAVCWNNQTQGIGINVNGETVLSPPAIYIVGIARKLTGSIGRHAPPTCDSRIHLSEPYKITNLRWNRHCAR